MAEPEQEPLIVSPVPPEVARLLVREWTILLVTFAGALPAPILRLLDVTGIWHLDMPSVLEAAVFGLGVFAAASLLTWASEVAETEMSAGLALVILALIAVLPEYAVDLYFAITAHSNPEHAHLAIANMTGGNRLLVGLAWPAVFVIFFTRTRIKDMPIIHGNTPGILFLGAATLYSFTIPLRGQLSLIDTAVMFGLFGSYLYLSSRAPPEEDRVFVGPAAAIAALRPARRRAVFIGVFVFAAAVIFAAAKPFADSLVATGESAGIDKFVLVQWVAPLASEAPEFILAGMLALRGRHDAGMTVLISSKVNQWTLLVGSLPLAYSIAGGTMHPLSFDARQSEEVLLTAAQSLFAVAILISLTIGRWEAIALAVLFVTQLAITDRTARLGYAGVYALFALLILFHDVPRVPSFLRIAGRNALRPGADQPARPPP